MLDIAELLRDAYILAAKYSHDPVTKVGAILVNQNHTIIGQGANCLPDGVTLDSSRFERPAKYDFIIHAEQNSIANAARLGHSTAKATLYCPWAACTFCARMIIQAGISKVVTHKALMIQTHMKWPGEIEKAHQMFKEAGVEYIEFDGVLGAVEHVFNGNLWHP